MPRKPTGSHDPGSDFLVRKLGGHGATAGDKREYDADPRDRAAEKCRHHHADSHGILSNPVVSPLELADFSAAAISAARAAYLFIGDGISHPMSQLKRGSK